MPQITVSPMQKLYQPPPGSCHLNLEQKLIPFGCVLAVDNSPIRKGKQLTKHHPSPGLQSQDFFPGVRIYLYGSLKRHL